MRTQGLLAFLAGVFVAASATAQLKDDQFKPPAKPGEFSDKVMFASAPAPPALAPPLLNSFDLFGPAAVKPPDPLWSGAAEFGLSGSAGNTDVLKIRLGGSARRKTDDNLFTSDLLFGLVQNGSVTTEKKALLNARDEFLFKNSPWALFLSGQLEYDEFRPYDFRVASHTGFAYQFFKTDATNVRTRLGAGFSREVGGPNDRWVPEGLVGFDLDQKITDRQQMLVTFDYYPDLGILGRYRVRTRAAYEVLLEPEWGLKLRFGIQDRFDSNPGPGKKNDLDYFTTMLFKF